MLSDIVTLEVGPIEWNGYRIGPLLRGSDDGHRIEPLGVCTFVGPAPRQFVKRHLRADRKPAKRQCSTAWTGLHAKLSHPFPRLSRVASAPFMLVEQETR